MRIDFYHLETTPLDKALPAILEKIYATGKHALLRTDLPERVSYINSLLWTYDPGSFIPHGDEKDGFADKQPIFITTKRDVNPNGAEYLVLIDGEPVLEEDSFERVFYFFNGLDEDALTKARDQWKTLKSRGFELHYWQQTPAGRWEQKN